MSSKDSGTSVRDILICGAKGLAIGIIAAAVLLFALAALAVSTKDPGKLAEILGYAALPISVGIAGIAAARSSGDDGAASALFGGCAGLMMLCLLLLMRFIPAEAAKNPLSGMATAFLYAAIPALSAACGFVFRKKSRRRQTHRCRR